MAAGAWHHSHQGFEDHMKLLPQSPHAHTLETERGAVLFSYRDPIAVRQGSTFYAMAATPASLDHLKAFLGDSPAVPVTQAGLIVTANFVLGA